MEEPRESRLSPVIVILAALTLLIMVPHHVEIMPMWVAHLAALAILVPMVAISFTEEPTATFWLRIERTLVVVFAIAYVVNTAAELADMVGIITLHPPEKRSISLLSSSLAIWVTNVLAFALLYWQVDRGGPYARAMKSATKPDWQFPHADAPEDRHPGWRPLFIDYLFLGFNTATAFSPTDASPLTPRAKILMMLESTISLITLVVVAARAINVIP